MYTTRMKTVLTSICLLFCLFSTAQDLNVMTFNIRYNNKGDSLNSWPYRKDKFISQILYHDVHVLGLQETLKDQMIDMQTGLPAFKSVGVACEDGKEKGEHLAIFYDTTRLQLLQYQDFWLSETPAVPGSKGWDAALPRMVTWAKFKDRKTKKVFFVFNNHFDHRGQIARRESAKMLLKRVNEIAGTTPAVIIGDFNARPSEEPIQVILDANNLLRLTDSYGISATPHYGPTGTFNAFGPKERDNEPIDFIFLKGKWKVLKHATISQTWEGRFASDHFAVLSSLKL
jgi:endonuclease/exonuclease/phosphatase family metal-dependent hydrolase